MLYLDYLHTRGLGGLHEFLYTFIGLLVARKKEAEKT